MLSARRLVASSLLKKTNSISFLISTPETLPISVPTRSYNKGSRGHGWYVKYRRGDGGRHLQGFQFDQTHYSNLNDKLFAHQAKSTTTAYLTIDTSTDATKGGRIELEVLSSLLPLAGSNFLKLLSHPDGYQKSTIMRVEKEVGVIFGGHKNACHPDLASLPGGTHFDDEGYFLAPLKGVAILVSEGKDKNESRFMILTEDSPHLVGRCVPFGRVKSGMDVVESVSKVFTKRGKPAVPLEVVSCGII